MWLASGSGGREGGELFVWDAHSGQRLNITGIRGLTEAQKAALRALGAIEGVAVDSP